MGGALMRRGGGEVLDIEALCTVIKYVPCTVRCYVGLVGLDHGR